MFDNVDISNILRSQGPVVNCVLLCSKPSADNTVETIANDVIRLDSNGLTTDTSKDTNDSHLKNNNQDKNDSAIIDNDNNINAKTTSDISNPPPRPILKHLIHQIKIDTTPQKSMVQQILGGPFTFLGQYEDEGIMVMIRRDAPCLEMENIQNDNDDENENDDNENGGDSDFYQYLEKRRKEVDASMEGFTLNPHILQPPLHDKIVYGDILLMRVAPSPPEDDDDDEQDVEEGGGLETVAKIGSTNEKEGSTPYQASNDEHDNKEFFLDYTKDEYIKFASRTDITPTYNNDDDDDDDDEDYEDDAEEEAGEGYKSFFSLYQHMNENDDDDEDDEYQVKQRPHNEEEDADDEDDDDDDDEANEEECQIGMLNLILGELLIKFREDNGRGPNTRELLLMRHALAEKLGVSETIVPAPPPSESSDDEHAEDDEGVVESSLNPQEGQQQQLEEDSKPSFKRSSSSMDDNADGNRINKRVKFSNENEVQIFVPTDDEHTSSREYGEDPEEVEQAYKTDKKFLEEDTNDESKEASI